MGECQYVFKLLRKLCGRRDILPVGMLVQEPCTGYTPGPNGIVITLQSIIFKRIVNSGSKYSGINDHI